MGIKRRTNRVLRRLRKHVIKPTHHFIHIPKNAGNSVREALGWRVSMSDPFHYRYVDIADQVGRNLKFFCIVRNPWSRTASRFKFAKQNSAKWPDRDPRKVYILSATFADFVRDQRIFDIPEHPGMPWMGPMNSWFNQLFWIIDENGEVACDCLRMEHISEDLEAYFGERISLPHRNASALQADYRQMYDDELIEIVAERFKEDIDYFGFSFDGSATRKVYPL